MRAIYTEVLMSQSPNGETGAGTVFDDNAIVVRVEDNAAGPFLVVHGRMEDRPADAPEGAFALDGTDVDQFAAVCKALLAQAE